MVKTSKTFYGLKSVRPPMMLPLGLLVLKFLGFKVVWPLGFLVSNFQSFEELPDANFMSSGRYYSNVQDLREFIERIGGFVLVPIFSKMSKHVDVHKHDTCKRNIFQKRIGILSWIRWSVLGLQNINIIGFGAQGHVRKSWNHRNEGFWVLPWAYRKVIRAKWTRIILRNF